MSNMDRKLMVYLAIVMTLNTVLQIINFVR